MDALYALFWAALFAPIVFTAWQVRAWLRKPAALVEPEPTHLWFITTQMTEVVVPLAGTVLERTPGGMLSVINGQSEWETKNIVLCGSREAVEDMYQP